uniref:WG repeat-containing protein n=1 Tax=Panagrellus redivivus TaxID=6233 RepID=A0A7E4UM74_PANRE
MVYADAAKKAHSSLRRKGFVMWRDGSSGYFNLERIDAPRVNADTPLLKIKVPQGFWTARDVLQKGGWWLEGNLGEVIVCFGGSSGKRLVRIKGVNNMVD